MRTILIFLFLFPQLAIAGQAPCSKIIKLKEVHISEKRVEVVTTQEGVTYGRIVECLSLNSEQVGDLKFHTPSKELASRKFPRGQRIIISRDEYDPFDWIFRYRYQSENIDGEGDREFFQFAHEFQLIKKLPLGRSLFGEVGAAPRFTRAFVVKPRRASDAANDFFVSGFVRFGATLPRENIIYLDGSFDRYLVFKERSDDVENAFRNRFSFRYGWEGRLFAGLSLGAHIGTSFLEGELDPGFLYGGLVKYTIYNFHFAYQYQMLQIDSRYSEDRSHQSTLILGIEF